MKNENAMVRILKSLAWVFFISAFGFGLSPVLGDEEISMDNDASGSTQVTANPTAVPSPQTGPQESVRLTPIVIATPVAGPPTTSASNPDLQEEETSGTQPIPTATAMAAANGMPTPTPVPAKSKVVLISSPEEKAPAAEEKPAMAEGILKMKDVYQAGMKYYKQEDYVQAVRYLKKALTVQDPYTSKFYYAEANAMLGVIYQFHIVHPDLAYQYYHEALKIDPTTETAKNHIHQVEPSQN